MTSPIKSSIQSSIDIDDLFNFDIIKDKYKNFITFLIKSNEIQNGKIKKIEEKISQINKEVRKFNKDSKDSKYNEKDYKENKEKLNSGSIKEFNDNLYVTNFNYMSDIIKIEEKEEKKGDEKDKNKSIMIEENKLNNEEITNKSNDQNLKINNKTEFDNENFKKSKSKSGSKSKSKSKNSENSINSNMIINVDQYQIEEIQEKLLKLEETISNLKQIIKENNEKSIEQQENQILINKIKNEVERLKEENEKKSKIEEKVEFSIRLSEENMKNQNEKLFSIEENLIKLSKNFTTQLMDVDTKLSNIDNKRYIKGTAENFSNVNNGENDGNDMFFNTFSNEISKVFSKLDGFKMILDEHEGKLLNHNSLLSSIQAQVEVMRKIENNPYIVHMNSQLDSKISYETERINDLIGNLNVVQSQIEFFSTNLSDKFSLVNDSINMISMELSQKTHKEEFESQVKDLKEDFFTNIARINEVLRGIEGRIYKSSSPVKHIKKGSNSIENTDIKLNTMSNDEMSNNQIKSMIDNLNKITKENIELVMNTKLDDYLQSSTYLNQNYKMSIILNTQAIENINDSIDKHNISILNIEKANEEFGVLKNQINYIKKSQKDMEKGLDEFKNYINNQVVKIKDSQQVEKNEADENNEENNRNVNSNGNITNMNMRSIVNSNSNSNVNSNNILNQYIPKKSVNSISNMNKIKEIEEKLDQIVYKVDTLIEEQNLRIKRELMIESSKIFDNFKSKLKHSMLSIEDQLQMKVDQLGLMELSKRFDKKLSDEIKLKIGVDDLRKNNNTLYKKIDDIQNKISKTLIDTLIDLQNEETPLILKTNMKNLTKCGSCDQPLKTTSIAEVKKSSHFERQAQEKIEKSDKIEKNESEPFGNSHNFQGKIKNVNKVENAIDSKAYLNHSNNFHSFLNEDKRKFNAFLTEEVDKYNVSSSRIINVANNIINKREKNMKK